jgi:hypothetical protein
MRRTVGIRGTCVQQGLLSFDCRHHALASQGTRRRRREERREGVFCRGPEPTDEGAQHVELSSHAEGEAGGKARGKVLREVGRGFQSSNERGKCS